MLSSRLHFERKPKTGLDVTNNLAYYVNSKITDVKSYVILDPGLSARPDFFQLNAALKDVVLQMFLLL